MDITYRKLYQQTLKSFPIFSYNNATIENLCAYVILHVYKYDEFPEEKPLA